MVAVELISPSGATAVGASMADRLNVYVDVFNLYHGLHDIARTSQHCSHRTPDTVSIIQGRYQGKKVTCKNCGGSWTKYEEKETDVNIAATLVADAARGRMSSALIVSADSDLVPGIRAARELAPANFFAAAFPPKRYSAELMALMPSSFHIGKTKINRSQLQDVVTDVDSGRRYERPDKWR